LRDEDVKEREQRESGENTISIAEALDRVGRMVLILYREQPLGTVCSITSALARMKELYPFVESKGRVDGMEVVRDSAFAGVGLQVGRRVNDVTCGIILITYLHSSFLPHIYLYHPAELRTLSRNGES
jgi:hypothetical protein